QESILDAKNVHDDPVRGCPEPRESTVDHDDITVSHDHPRFVFKRPRHALDEIEQAATARADVGTVLDVIRRPIARCGLVVALIEEPIERFEDQRLVRLFNAVRHFVSSFFSRRRSALHPFKKSRAHARKTSAYCECAPWLASGYITSCASGRYCSKRKA